MIYSLNDNTVALGSIQSQLIEADGHYYFTAFAEEGSDTDLILVRTDLDGKIGDTCAVSTSIVIPVVEVTNPVFYTQTPVVFDFIPQLIMLSVTPGTTTTLQSSTICATEEPVESVVDTIICQGHSYDGYTTDGFYTDTLTSYLGCDSIRSLQLQVTEQLQSFQDRVICPGQLYEGYSQPGMYIDTFISYSGCDSVRTLLLLVALPESYQQQEICSGGEFEGHTLPGLYIDTLPGMASECDTIRYITLTVSPPIVTSFSHQTCYGVDYFGYTAMGTYTDTFSSADGCDSIRTVLLEVMLPVETLIQTTVCNNETPGFTYPGTYIDTLTSINGCDSIRTLHLQGSAVYIPNVFSPNNDLVNDVFEVTQHSEEEMDLISFTIFDRWGNQVHQSSTGPVQWDGKGKNGTLLNPGVFTYLLTFSCGDQEVKYDGSITLVR